MFIGATMVIKGILLAHIESNLGEKPGIPPPKKKKPQTGSNHGMF